MNEDVIIGGHAIAALVAHTFICIISSDLAIVGIVKTSAEGNFLGLSWSCEDVDDYPDAHGDDHNACYHEAEVISAFLRDVGLQRLLADHLVEVLLKLLFISLIFVRVGKPIAGEVAAFGLGMKRARAKGAREALGKASSILAQILIGQTKSREHGLSWQWALRPRERQVALDQVEPIEDLDVGDSRVLVFKAFELVCSFVVVQIEDR